MAIYGEMEGIEILFDMLQQNRLRQTRSVIFVERFQTTTVQTIALTTIALTTAAPTTIVRITIVPTTVSGVAMLQIMPVSSVAMHLMIVQFALLKMIYATAVGNLDIGVKYASQQLVLVSWDS